MENFSPDPKPGRLILPLVLIGMIATTYTFINRVTTNNNLEVINIDNDLHNLHKIPEEAEQELRLKIPSVVKSDINLNQTGEELVIEVGRYRRNMLLPRLLQKREVLSASMDSGTLKVWFGGVEND